MVWQPDSFRIRLNRRSTFNYGWDILAFDIIFSLKTFVTPSPIARYHETRATAKSEMLYPEAKT
jgi:hypothetical protein